MSKKNNPSSTHHYVPKFYIKGFCNSNGMLYVYDKQTGLIDKRPRSPKSILFEPDRNLLEIDGKKNSSLEDEFYKRLDDYCAKTIIPLRDEPNVDGLLTVERIHVVRYFALNLFWRIPFSDPVFNDLFERSTVTVIDKKTGEPKQDHKAVKGLKSNENYKKLKRSIMATESIVNWIYSNPIGGETTTLFDEGKPIFLLTDNPLVFKDTPKTVQELVTSEYFFALSCRRIYCTVQNQQRYFDDEMSFAYNVLQVAQAKRFVCAPTLEILESFMKYFDVLKEAKLIHEAKVKLFKKSGFVDPKLL